MGADRERWRTLKFGLDVATSGEFADVRLFASLAAEAEAASWDGFFIWDILLSTGGAGLSEPVIDPWIALAAIAISTSRLRFGALMTPLARHRPWDIARSVATLDYLSGGRITLGAGLGFHAEEFTLIGRNPMSGSEQRNSTRVSQSLKDCGRALHSASVGNTTSSDPSRSCQHPCKGPACRYGQRPVGHVSGH